RGVVWQVAVDWWRAFFDETYPRRYAIDEGTTAAEVAMLRQLLPPPPARVLDAACGQGRHSIALAQAGYTVTGVDASGPLLAIARAAAAEAGVSVEFVEADLREFSTERSFDAAINMFTAFGYFEDDAENLRVLN